MEPELQFHLLSICDLSKQWPSLQALHDLAMLDLMKANDDAKVELEKRRAEVVKAKAEADAKAKAEADAKAKSDERVAQARAVPASETSYSRNEPNLTDRRV